MLKVIGIVASRMVTCMVRLLIYLVVAQVRVRPVVMVGLVMKTMRVIDAHGCLYWFMWVGCSVKLRVKVRIDICMGTRLLMMVCVQVGGSVGAPVLL